MSPIEIEVDSRGRASLSRIAEPGAMLRISPRGDGTYLLEPLNRLTDAEVALLKNPDAAAALDRGLAGEADVVDFGPEDL